ncbi:hypothetical protein [Amaricoccus sp.]|uniref:hypothetical protein n=1 Tax=Amaricoccus sp. TaxID=1872485 RepID=UPI0025C04CE9|nr:hypothetical protein [Amaricoccus sp.]
MLDRRRLLAALAALLLPAPRVAAASLAATPASGVRIVDGWILTARDVAEIDRLAR